MPSSNENETPAFERLSAGMRLARPTGQKAPRLGVVIVAFNSERVLTGCLRALDASIHHASARIPGLDTHIVIVDNASLEPVALPSTTTTTQVMRLPWNVGFSPAVNQAWAALSDHDWILLLNPDAELYEDALWRLLDKGMRRSAGLVGPMFVGDDGTPCGESERGFHSIRTELAQQFWSRRRPPPASETALRTGNARCLSGATLLIRADLLERTGGLDTRIRMYLEDVQLCWNAHQLGYPVVLAPEAKSIHALGGSSAGVNFNSSVKLRLTLLAARVEFARRCGGRLASTTVRLVMALGAAGRVVVCALRRDPVRLHAVVLRWALQSGKPPAWGVESEG